MQIDMSVSQFIQAEFIFDCVYVVFLKNITHVCDIHQLMVDGILCPFTCFMIYFQIYGGSYFPFCETGLDFSCGNFEERQACTLYLKLSQHPFLKLFCIVWEKVLCVLFCILLNLSFVFVNDRRTVCQYSGHQGAVRGLTVSTDGRILVSCGTDCT